MKKGDIYKCNCGQQWNCIVRVDMVRWDVCEVTILKKYYYPFVRMVKDKPKTGESAEENCSPFTNNLTELSPTEYLLI